jgi:hypothetical protein
VIGPRLWESRYRSRRSAIGSVIQLFERDYRIVGVLRESPAFPFDADIWASRSAQNGFACVFGRIRPGKTLRDVQYEWTAFRQRVGGRWPAEAAWLRNLGRDTLLDSFCGAASAHSRWSCCWPAPTSRVFKPDTLSGVSVKWPYAWPSAPRMAASCGF